MPGMNAQTAKYLAMNAQTNKLLFLTFKMGLIRGPKGLYFVVPDLVSEALGHDGTLLNYSVVNCYSLPGLLQNQ